MDENDLVTVALSALAFLLSLVTGVSMCLCCYCWLKKEKKYDSLNNDGYYNLAPNENVSETKERKLSKLKLKGQPQKVVESHGIQPSQYLQSGLNHALGLGPGMHDRTLSDAPTFLDMPETVPESAVSEALDHKLGRLQFSLHYETATQNLVLKIIRAADLIAKDLSGTSDPYVKILLLPDRKIKLTTKIKRKNLNPHWNEIFLFEGFPYNKLMDRTLYLQVLDYDRFSRDDPIGELYLPLAGIDILNDVSTWMDLQPCIGSRGKLGELLISLCYEPTLGRLTIVILKARELKAKDINGYSDPYVKIWLMKQDKKVEKRKTSTKSRSLNPVYNESFVYELSYPAIRQTSLRITVMDHDTIGRNEKIGELLIGARSGQNEVKHWNSMFAKPRHPVAQWHMLKNLE